MDPHFKTFSFLKREVKKDIEFRIESEMIAILTAAENNKSEGYEPPVKKFRGEHKLLELLEGQNRVCMVYWGGINQQEPSLVEETEWF